MCEYGSYNSDKDCTKTVMRLSRRHRTTLHNHKGGVEGGGGGGEKKLRRLHSTKNTNKNDVMINNYSCYNRDNTFFNSCFTCSNNINNKNHYVKLILFIFILSSLTSTSLCSGTVEKNNTTDLVLRRIERDSKSNNERRVVCYYTNWSVYRPGTAKFSPQNINPYLCTHLIYAFGGLDKENGLRPYDKYQDIEQGGYAKFTGLKTYNKALKTMLAIGGWNEGSARFSPLVADEERRKEFVKNVIKFLRQNHFDGLDLDWEYPAFRDGGKSRDRDNYARLVQELREEFDRESDKTGRTRLLLTMAVPAGIEYIDKGYDVPKLNRYLDFMNILSYDYHSAFEPAVNHHSPLYSLEEDNEYNFDAQLSIDYTVKHYLKSGADRDKLVLGIPTYGRSYTLFNPESNQLGAPADGPGEQGDATREKGYLAYYEICSSLKNDKEWKVEHPKRSAMGPYAFKENQWVGYDDEDIVREKAKYVNEQNLGGIMFWSIDNDDFRGNCHNRPYPLIEAGKEVMLGTSATTSSKKSSSKNTESSSTNNESKTTRPLTVSPLQRRPKPTKLKPAVGRIGAGSTTQRTSYLQSSAVASSRQTTTQQPQSNSLTTPEPPTTPDPGSDFVCKDEGFFPHPRDCKKYFWCLDSGPSNLGIVAHQFTCPSGLFFNKAADSCDFARNVLCKEKKEKKTTTPAAESTSTTSTTTSNPRLKLTAATAKSTGIRYTYTSTTTTTTTTTEAPPPPPEEEVGEDDYDHAEEDPQAIKQLIMLIKKLGGVAELEKQLENAAGGSTSNVTPPSTISRNLYNRLLTPGKYQSPYRNGPSGPQNEGLTGTGDGGGDGEGTSYRREKPQYVTISRERPSTKSPSQFEETPSDERGLSRFAYKTLNRHSNHKPVVEDETDDVEEPEEERVTVRPLAATPKYKLIDRRRPTTTATEDQRLRSEGIDEIENGDVEDNDTALRSSRPESSGPRYTSIQRSRPTTAQSDDPSTTSRYVTLNRQRPAEETQLTQILEDTTSSSSSSPYFRKDGGSNRNSNSRVKIFRGKNNFNSNNNENGGDEIADDAGDERSSTVRVTTSAANNNNKVSGGLFIKTTSTTPVIPIVSDNSININNNNNYNDDNSLKLPLTTTSIIAATSTEQTIITNKTVNRDSSNNNNSIVETAQTTLATTIPISKYSPTDSDRFTFETSEVVTAPAPTATIPYQTSTITSIVTMVVEGATERQKIPLSRLEEVLADHNKNTTSSTDNPDSHLSPFIPSDTMIHDDDNGKTNLLINSNQLLKNNQLHLNRRLETSVRNRESATKANESFLSRRRNKILSESNLNSEEVSSTQPSSSGRRFSPSRSKLTNKFSVSKRNETSPLNDSQFDTPANKFHDKRRRRPVPNSFSLTRNRSSATTGEDEIGTSPTYFPSRSRSKFVSDRGRSTTPTTSLGGSTTSRSRSRFVGRNRASISTPFDSPSSEPTTEFVKKSSSLQQIKRRRKPANAERVNILQEELNNVNKNIKEDGNQNSRQAPKIIDDTAEILLSMENKLPLIKSNNFTISDKETGEHSTERKTESSPVNYIVTIRPEYESGYNNSNYLIITPSLETVTFTNQLPSSHEETTIVNSEILSISPLTNVDVSTTTEPTKTYLTVEPNEPLTESPQGFKNTLINEILPLQKTVGSTLISNTTTGGSRSRGRGRARFTAENIVDLSSVENERNISKDSEIAGTNQRRHENRFQFLKDEESNTTSSTLAQHFSKRPISRSRTVKPEQTVIQSDRSLQNTGRIRITKRRRIHEGGISQKESDEENKVRRKNTERHRSNEAGTKNEIINNEVGRNTNARRGSKKFSETIDNGVENLNTNITIGENLLKISVNNKTNRIGVLRRRILLRNRNQTVDDNLIDETISRTSTGIAAPISNRTDSNRTRKVIIKHKRKDEGVDDDKRKIKSRRADDDLDIGRSEYNESDNVYPLSNEDSDAIFLKQPQGFSSRSDDDFKERDNDLSPDFIEPRKSKEILKKTSPASHRQSSLESEVNRARVAVRRPVSRKPINNNENTTDRQALSTADIDTVTARSFSRTPGKYLRRRVNKHRVSESSDNNINDASDSNGPSTLQQSSLDGSITTQRPKKFEFPKRTGRPSTTLQQPLASSPLQRTTASSDESPLSSEGVSGGSDSQIVESKEELATTEEGNNGGSTLPDLANVAVAAIQSLATQSPLAPPTIIESTTTYPSSVAVTPRRTTSLSSPSTPVFISTVSVSSPSTVAAAPISFGRGTVRPFAKKRVTTQSSAPSRVSAPKPSYITKPKVIPPSSGAYDPSADYESSDFYVAEPVDVPLSGKVRIHNDGYIECLDIGNFPHPFSCKKFISCAKMENGHLLGWEYTCPRGLSFDPIGGICNWSAGLGCKE